ncbi:MAG: hypothetical protein A2V65_00385 [Deltaproteobacteria bacterium RBG_13_49_15]|nr:MAG: hypothetical protein A2V65_00385 [Deltaproteobacteria bacterium RBG_13_49_15]
MILSFHPCYAAGRNILCAGRDPGAEEFAAIKEAQAVILPQGCRKTLYRMAKENCPYVFPNYEARFQFPGKTGQLHLFQKTGTPHPTSRIFFSVEDFTRQYPGGRFPFMFPFVFKRDWGGEGEGVFLVDSQAKLKEVINEQTRFESGEKSPFILQEYVPSQNRSLRVVIVNKSVVSYWRVQNALNSFLTNLSAGADIDAASDPNIQQSGIRSVLNFCETTGINLAGFDVLFSNADPAKPLMLEINYFFGRKGLGGSEKYYDLLEKEIDRWLFDLKLSVK